MQKEESTVRAYVDKDACIGCGLCEGACPEVFALDDEGKAAAIADTTEENRAGVMDAIAGCPVEAIREEE
jgi:ferredoxin